MLYLAFLIVPFFNIIDWKMWPRTLVPSSWYSRIVVVRQSERFRFLFFNTKNDTHLDFLTRINDASKTLFFPLSIIISTMRIMRTFTDNINKQKEKTAASRVKEKQTKEHAWLFYVTRGQHFLRNRNNDNDHNTDNARYTFTKAKYSKMP